MLHRLLHRPIPPALLLPLLVGGIYLAYARLPGWESAMMSIILGGILWLTVLLGEWVFAKLYQHVERRVDRYLERCAAATREMRLAADSAAAD